MCDARSIVARAPRRVQAFRTRGRASCKVHCILDDLESTDPDAIVDTSRKLEMHMPSDRPGMLMRSRLNALLHAHGEHEVPR